MDRGRRAEWCAVLGHVGVSPGALNHLPLLCSGFRCRALRRGLRWWRWRFLTFWIAHQHWTDKPANPMIYSPFFPLFSAVQAGQQNAFAVTRRTFTATASALACIVILITFLAWIGAETKRFHSWFIVGILRLCATTDTSWCNLPTHHADFEAIFFSRAVRSCFIVI